MPPKYKLTYFNLRGRAETIRMLFAAADVKFEDVRITFEEWPELKPKMPHNVLPVLEVNGTQISQSFAIAKFVAKEVQLYGKNNLEGAFIDQISDTLRDIGNAGIKWFSEKDETKKAEYRAQFLAEDVPKNLKLIENDIGKFGKDGFAVSKWLSVADIAIFTVTEFFQLRDCLGDYPKIAASIKKVEENRNLAKYLKERPDVPF